MADTIYKQLAVALDNLPNGFPSTDCGVEIEILKMMFSPEEALVAANMSEVYEAVTAIAECCGRTVADVKLLLVKAGRKGLIRSELRDGQRFFRLAAFIVLRSMRRALPGRRYFYC